MTFKVVDASAAASIFFGEDEAPQVTERLAGADLIAPTLLPYEMANICASKIRRQSDRRDQFHSGLLTFLATDIRFEPVDHAAVAELAVVFRLSAYDASYLWLAREFGAELVTLDRELARAAGQ